MMSDANINTIMIEGGFTFLLHSINIVCNVSAEDDCEVPIVPGPPLAFLGLVGGGGAGGDTGAGAGGGGAGPSSRPMHHYHPTPYHLRRKSPTHPVSSCPANTLGAAAASVAASPTTASPAGVSAATAGLPSAATGSVPMLSPTAAITAATAYCPSMLPARKRPRRTYFTGDTSTGMGTVTDGNVKKFIGL